MTTFTFACAFKPLSADRCALDWPEWPEEPDAVWMVWSLPRYLHPVADWWAISCHQPPGRLCPHQRKGNTHSCSNAQMLQMLSMNAMIMVLFLSAVCGPSRTGGGLTTFVRRCMDTSVRRRPLLNQLKAPKRKPTQDASLWVMLFPLNNECNYTTKASSDLVSQCFLSSQGLNQIWFLLLQHWIWDENIWWGKAGMLSGWR